MNNHWQKIDQFLEQTDELLITSHIDPDGDAIGSTLAVAQACKQLGKRVVCVNESLIPEKFSFLSGIDEIQNPHNLNKKFRYVIAVDAADRSRVGLEVESLFHPDVLLLNIDHHVTNDRYGTFNVIDPDASSTAEVIFHWLDTLPNFDWNSTLATYLYTGILTDTGGFRYSNTTAKVLRIAAQLIDCGASANEIADQILETATITQISCLQKALSTLEITKDGQIAWLNLSLADLKQLDAANSDVEGIVNVARNILGVDVGIFFYEKYANKIKVSFRSRRKINVAKIAKEFGGGGHSRAAGCMIEGRLEEVKQQVIQRVEAELGRV